MKPTTNGDAAVACPPITYVYRAGYSVPGVPAEVAKNALEDIRARHGAIEAETVVEEARKKSNPLHNAFTWDDTEAARQHRLAEARQLVRSVMVVKDAVARPYFVHVQVERNEEDDGPAAHRRPGQYLPVSVVVRHENLLERALRQVRVQAESVVSSLEQIAEAAQEERTNRIQRRAIKAAQDAAETLRTRIDSIPIGDQPKTTRPHA